MNELLGKKAIITGGTSGIGFEIAKRFVNAGADVAILGTNPDNAKKAEAVLIELKGHPEQKILSLLVNVADKKAVDEKLAQLLQEFSSIDILVNNAGITRDNLLMRMSEEEWDQVLEVNLKSAYNTCKVVVRPMMKAKSGRIINISSVIGLTGNAGQANYAASKAGLIGFTKSLAKELASRGITANCIAPGYIRTRMTDGLGDKIKDAILEKIPMGRIGEASDIAEAALFLASDKAKYITGQVLTVDGGMVI